MRDTPRPAPKNTAVYSGAFEGQSPPNNLPIELSSFVGRGRETAEIEALPSGRRDAR